jgi:hypothetical protein
VAEREKSLDPSVQLAVSVYYNWDITKERKMTNTMTSLQLSEKAPPDWGLHLEFATVVDRRALPQGMLKGRQLRRQPRPPWDPALSAKVTTGGLSAPVSRWKVRCHLLWIDGSWGLLSTLHLLISILRSLG